MNPRVLRRFIILMAALTVGMFLFWDLLKSYVTQPAGDFDTKMGDQRLTEGNLEAALEHFNLALEDSPNHRGALMGRALVFIQQDDHVNAVAELDHLIDYLNDTLEDDDGTERGALASAYANRGIAHDRAGQYEKALEDYIASLRVRPETLCRITEFSEHESNGRELDEGERVAVEVLPVLGQSAAAVEPGDGAFDHPTPGLDDEALHPIGSLDDLGLEIGQDAGQGAVKDRALIGAVGEQFPEKGKQTEQGRQQRETAVAILNVGGGDDAVQQQALRIDQNMPLLALDQLAGIEAVAVDASPPFSALFTL